MSVKAGKKGRKKRTLWLVIAGVVLLLTVLFLLWFFVWRPKELNPEMSYTGETRTTDTGRPAAEEYMSGLGTVTGSIPAPSAGIALTEAVAIRAFAARGFTQAPVAFYYGMDGQYLTEREAQETSSERHPYYQSIYVTESGAAWLIYTDGDAFLASSLSERTQQLVSERDTVRYYDGAANAYYEITPGTGAVEFRQVERIDAQALAALSAQ